MPWQEDAVGMDAGPDYAPVCYAVSRLEVKLVDDLLDKDGMAAGAVVWFM
jgi:hypothetical protein